MAQIVDRRLNGKNKSAVNRKNFYADFESRLKNPLIT